MSEVEQLPPIHRITRSREDVLAGMDTNVDRLLGGDAAGRAANMRATFEIMLETADDNIVQAERILGKKLPKGHPLLEERIALLMDQTDFEANEAQKLLDLKNRAREASAVAAGANADLIAFVQNTDVLEVLRRAVETRLAAKAAVAAVPFEERDDRMDVPEELSVVTTFHRGAYLRADLERLRFALAAAGIV